MDKIQVLLRRQLTAAWRYRWATVACAWIVCGMGWVASTMIPNQYESSARLFVDADAVLTPLLRGIAVENQSGAQLDMLQRTLLSRPNIEKLISNTDLDLTITGPADLERLVEYLAGAIKIIPQTRNLFTITFRNPSPKLSFDVVQTILTTFIESKTGNNRSEMQNAQQFVEAQLANYERQLRDAEKRRADFRTRYMDLLPGEGNGQTRLEQQQVTVRQLQGTLQDETAKRDMLKNELGTVPPLLVTETDALPNLGTLPNGQPVRPTTPGAARYQEALTQLEELRLRYTENHPDVVAARRRAESLKAGAADLPTGKSAAAPATPGAPAPQQRNRSQPNPVYEQIKVRLLDSESLLSSLQRQLNDGVRERDRLLEIARGAPGLQAEYTNLNRDYDVLRKNFEELLGRRESMRIAAAAEADADKIKIQVIDPPLVPQIPVAPKRALIITGVLLVGVGAGFGLALLLAQFDQSFHTLDELREFGLQVAGSISLIAVTSRTSIIVNVVSFSMAFMLLGAVYVGLLVRMLKSTGSY
jgi:polysaccharide chain length determinant protein (PEP-CTERM system associated)